MLSCKRKFLSKALGYRLALAAVAFVTAQRANAFGLIVPNGTEPGKDELYYKVLNKDLVRFACPNFATDETCAKSGVPLGNFDSIHTAVVNELNQNISALEIAIESETRSLKEKDSKVAAFKASVLQSGVAIDKLEQEIAALKIEKESAAQNSLFALNQIAKIDAKLRTSLDEAALKRLLKERERYQEKLKEFAGTDAKATAAIESKKKEQAKLNDQVKKTSEELSAYVGKLAVMSPELTKYEGSLKASVTERRLLREFVERISDPDVSYELKTWDEPGAPELFARFMKHSPKPRK